ncbi:MAG: PhoH family protein, partial [Acidobacteriota bacterium]
MKKIVLPEKGAEILFDSQDENVRLLENLFDVRISARGEHISIEGGNDGVQKISDILTDFSDLVSGGVSIENGELRNAFRQISLESAKSLRDLLPKKIIIKTPVREVVPRSINQIKYLQQIEKNDLVFGIGPAGTG